MPRAGLRAGLQGRCGHLLCPPQSLLSDSSRWCVWESNPGLLGGPPELFTSDPFSSLYFKDLGSDLTRDLQSGW
ncbi:hypothetical protein ACRRTK_007671 [Alexandromys fortis]